MNADEYTARVYYLSCGKVVFSGGTFFYRKNNPNAITVKLSKRTFDLPYTEYMLWLLIRSVGNFDDEVECKVLKRSIRGLLHYYPYTFNSEFKEARAQCRELFDRMQKDNVCSWLNSKDHKRYTLEKLSTSSYKVFVLTSFFLWFIKRLRKLFMG